MPHITIDEKTMTKVKAKVGVYKERPKLQDHALRKEEKRTEVTIRAESVFYSQSSISTIRDEILRTVERAFREYCQGHGANIDMENKEWRRFFGKLSKFL